MDRCLFGHHHAGESSTAEFAIYWDDARVEGRPILVCDRHVAEQLLRLWHDPKREGTYRIDTYERVP